MTPDRATKPIVSLEIGTSDVGKIIRNLLTAGLFALATGTSATTLHTGVHAGIIEGKSQNRDTVVSRVSLPLGIIFLMTSVTALVVIRRRNA